MADASTTTPEPTTNETKEERLDQNQVPETKATPSGPRVGTHVGYDDVLHRSDMPITTVNALDSTEPGRTVFMNRAALNPVEGPVLEHTLSKPHPAVAPGDTQGRPNPNVPMSSGNPQQPLMRGGAAVPPPVQEMPVNVVPHAEPNARMTQADANATPTLRDVGSTFSRWAVGRVGGAAGWLGRHAAIFTVIIAVGLAATLGITIASASFAKLPEDGQIRSDANSYLEAPTPSVGVWDSDEPLILTTTEITEKATDGSDPDVCVVSIRATFSNDGVSALATGRLSYTKKDDAWTCTDAITEDGAAFSATTGVNGERAAESFLSLLQRAEETEGNEVSYESASLASLFDGSAVTVTGEGFDGAEQTSAVALHLTHATTFVSRECDLSANFAFVPASGSWELREVYVSGSPYDLNYGPILGTWYGTFLKQTTRDGKCLSAADSGLTVNVESVEANADGELCVTGTLSGIAHFHSSVRKNQDSDEGDTWLDNVAFTGTADNNASGIAFDCEARDLSGGKLELRLEFGSPSEPDAATATLTTSHDYEDHLWIFSYSNTARFADEFSLEKAA